MLLLDDNINNKFNYDNEMIKFLDKLGLAMISYYGKKYLELIRNSLNNINIHFYKDASSEKNIYDYYNLPFHQSSVSDAGQLCIEYKNHKPLIFIKIYDDKNITNKRLTLIHEFIHGVMTYGCIEVSDNIAIEKTGFSVFEFELDGYNKKYIDIKYKKKEKDSLHILEEGLTEYDACMLYNLVYPDIYDYEISYRYYVSLVSNLMNYPLIRKIINDSRITKDYLMESIDSKVKNKNGKEIDLKDFIINFRKHFPHKSEEIYNYNKKLLDYELELHTEPLQLKKIKNMFL